MKQIRVRGSTSGRPIMRLLDILGRRWALRILWELREERLSFRRLQERCDQVSPSSLNQRLREMRDLQLIDLDDGGYGYTAWGEELLQHLLPLHQWAEDWARTLPELDD